jgi:hypothetical protein
MALRTESLQDFNPRSTDQLFRWSLGKTLLPTVLFFVLTGLGLNELFGPSPFTDLPTFALVISTLGFMLMAWVAWIQTRAGLGKNALVAALDNKNLWVRVRSPLNAQVGTPADNLLVALPLDQIRWSQLITVQTIKVMNRKPRTTYDYFLDLGTDGFDADSLKQLLAEERTMRKKASQSSLHFPIKLLTNGRIRLSLYNVSGGAEGLQKRLPSGLETKEPQREMKDLR